jgi:YVTN family beta-propeller protein
MAMILLLLAAIPALQADELIVINNLGETLSKIDLETGAVDNNFVTVGLIPNAIVCAGDRAYVVNSGSDDLYIVDLESETVGDIIDLGSGRNPWSLSFMDDSTLLVTNFISSTVSKVNINTKAVVGEWAVNTRPQGLITIGKRTYIAISGFNPADTSYGPGSVAVWDNIGDSVVQYVGVGTNPQDLDIGSDGRLNVVCTGDYEGLPGMLYVVDTGSLSVTDSFQTATTFFPPSDVVVTSDGTGFLAAGGWFDKGEVYTFDPLNGVMLHDQNDPLNTGLGVIAVSRASDSTIYSYNFGADNITEMDSSGLILNTYNVGDGPQIGDIRITGPDYICGDVNDDSAVNVSDAVSVINYVFIGGEAPNPMESGDVNCDLSVNVSDAVWIINYVFIGGKGPCDTDGDDIPDC